MKKINNIIVKIIGYILISPAIAGVILFFLQLIAKVPNKDLYYKFTNTIWDSGLIVTLPIYFGLMTIVGAYLIKDNKNK